MPRLTVIKGADEGKQFDLVDDELTAGRDAANKVRLHDTEVSRRHAEFIRTADGFRVLDSASANGTFVNGRAVRDVLLRSGDQIQIGQTLLIYSSTSTTTSGAPGDLANRISLIARQDLDLPSAIIKTIGETEGSRILSRPGRMESAWLKDNLGTLYEAIHAASHILDLDLLLSRLLELTFRGLDADRGCILLREFPEGAERGHDQLTPDQFVAKAVRWRDGTTREETIPVSRTLTEYVLREKQGILVSDAARDERFQASQSLVRFGTREVICVPMRGRHDTLGLFYLDARTPATDAVLPPARFNADHLALAIALAHQAALAVEDTRYHEAMVHAERLAAVGQTIASLSHHIKNILQGLRSGGEILKMGLNDKDQQLLLQGWKIIEKNQGKVYDLVTDMLSYSKEREPVLLDVNLAALAADVVELVAARARDRGITLTLVPPDPLMPLVAVDEEAIHRALLNLVGNALDAVEEADNPVVLVRLTREEDGQWVRLEVQDNGTGIPPERMADLFRPFVSTKGARGTGLGLAVSRKILREHGGDIVVTSTPGQGSTFALRLPMRTAPRVEASNTLVPTRPPLDEE